MFHHGSETVAARSPLFLPLLLLFYFILLSLRTKPHRSRLSPSRTAHFVLLENSPP